MESLPREVALDILSRLPITSLQQFKFVCKSWHSLTQDPLLPRTYHTRSVKNNPSLILHCNHSLKNQLYIIDNDAHGNYDNSAQELNPPFKSVAPDFEVAGSCNGLLCLSDDSNFLSDGVYIYNPFTNESIKLPEAKKYKNEEVVLGFGFHPTTKEYKVIGMAYCFPPISLGCFHVGYEHSEARVFTLGTDSWRSLGKTPYWVDRDAPRALVNGVLHWVTQCHKYEQYQYIVSFHLETEVFHKVPSPSCENFKRQWYTIAELGGCLCAVASVLCYYEEQIVVWMMKDYNVKESWTKEFIIRAHIPIGLNPDIKLYTRRMRKRIFRRGCVRVLCLLKGGEILLEYGNQVLVTYDPAKDEFKDLNFHGLPNCFESVTHIGSLVSLKDTVKMGK